MLHIFETHNMTEPASVQMKAAFGQLGVRSDGMKRAFVESVLQLTAEAAAIDARLTSAREQAKKNDAKVSTALIKIMVIFFTGHDAQKIEADVVANSVRFKTDAEIDELLIKATAETAEFDAKATIRKTLVSGWVTACLRAKEFHYSSEQTLTETANICIQNHPGLAKDIGLVAAVKNEYDKACLIHLPRVLIARQRTRQRQVETKREAAAVLANLAKKPKLAA
jgi:hypothetical protein